MRKVKYLMCFEIINFLGLEGSRMALSVTICSREMSLNPVAG